MPATHLITGIQASGKSTVAQALAAALDGPSVHVHGDQFRRWVVNGRADMTPDPSPEALEQLRLRHRLTAATCAGYAAAGFAVVVQDVVLGPQLPYLVDLLRPGSLHVVVLAPRADVVAERDRARAKVAYDSWTIELFDRGLREETPRIGLWLDTSTLTVAESVAEILARQAESRVE